MDKWLKISDYTASTGSEYKKLISLARSHYKSGYENRFRKINEIFYINKNYLSECEKERLELEALWFQVREHFNSDFSMAKYFAQIVDKTPYAVNKYFSTFKFGGLTPDGHRLRKLYIEAFIAFLRSNKSYSNDISRL